ncbi:vWA domain-containing protein [Stenotrophobium rhamnosiphilum]|nr:VWA domain-containing protein [Stenotrophobium rhamnosiphilum]
MKNPQNLPRFRLTLMAAAIVFAAACGTTAPTSKEDSATVVPKPAPPPVTNVVVESEIKNEPQFAPSLLAGAQDAVMQRERRDYAAKAAAPSMAMGMMTREAYVMPMPQPQDREAYAHLSDNPIHRAAEQPVSTFSIDVDTGSYANVRRFLNEGRLPPTDAVRVEELINYFDLAGAAPNNRETPFSVQTELAPTPWNTKTKLLRVGIKGYLPQGPLPPSNLVFLVDVSGSMQDSNKLPLVKSALKLLTRQLKANDRISLVTYAGNTAVVLEPTSGDQKSTIEQAIDRLDAGGSTNGAGGIQLAYQQAEKAFIKNGNNRILLATDGDFNVGVTRFESLIDMVKEKRKTGVALTTLGFGTGNYNDQLMEQVADAGDGNYSYIDSLQEAQKVLVAQSAATLLTIAKDVKIQVEFNPAQVSEYRLIGYENRALKREDFNNDKVDAGEIGAGHAVTALYEILLSGEGGDSVDPLRYSKKSSFAAPGVGQSGEVAFVRLRYKRPNESTSRLIEEPVRREQARNSIAAASESLRLGAAVAAFGQKLKGGTYTGNYGYNEIATLAKGAQAVDNSNSVGEFVRLVGLAQSLSAQVSVAPTPQMIE